MNPLTADDLRAFESACREIIASSTVNAYAREYARAGLKLTAVAIPTQAAYILSNLTHWRAPEAAAVRIILKRVAKCAPPR